MKKSVVKENEERKEQLKEAFVLWRNEAKSKVLYLAGFTSDDLGKQKLIGYFNTNKKSPNEADIRVYTLNKENKQDKEIASLWESSSQNGKRYLTGITDEKEKLVAFYGDENQEKRPYIRAYFREE